MQYTNQTAEELETYRCASSGIFEAQNSIWMKINFAFTFSLILLTFVISIKAVQVLKFRNVYSSGTQFLLYVTLVNVNFNQLVYMVIRIRHLIQILSFSKDICLIEFHNSECYYDNHLYMFSNYLATWLVCSLTFDRFLAYYTRKLYDDRRNSKRIGVMLVGGSIFFTLLCHLYIFYGVPRAGYVPSCQYPPQLALDAFQLATILKVVFTLFNCLVILLVLLVVVGKDRRIRHCNYDTNTRYFSFENVLTTKAILTIAVTQLFFSCLSSVAVTVVRYFEGGMSEHLFHTLTQYVAGLLYGNLSIPILIYLKTSQCSAHRHRRITRMTMEPDLMESRMTLLKNMWEK